MISLAELEPPKQWLSDLNVENSLTFLLKCQFLDSTPSQPDLILQMEPGICFKGPEDSALFTQTRVIFRLQFEKPLQAKTTLQILTAATY